jgi:hypothetical protein
VGVTGGDSGYYEWEVRGVQWRWGKFFRYGEMYHKQYDKVVEGKGVEGGGNEMNRCAWKF